MTATIKTYTIELFDSKNTSTNEKMRSTLSMARACAYKFASIRYKVVIHHGEQWEEYAFNNDTQNIERTAHSYPNGLGVY